MPTATLPSPPAYTCPATQQAYVVSTGGNPGLPGTIDNSAIFLVAALGPCAGINSSTFVVINEVSTVAAAYSFSGFLPIGGAGLTEAAVTGGAAMAGVTTSATNTRGLTDASANALNIVSVAAGLPNPTSTGGNGAIPAATLDSLADILQDCVNSSLPSSNNCTNLFTAATPPTGSGVTAPVNVFQAALDIAQYPGNNVGTLFGLISATSAFAPTLPTAPNDWTVGITYTSSQIATPLGLVLDANDNVFITGSTTADLAELSPQGVVLSPTAATGQSGFTPTFTTAAHNWRNGAFDLSGNLFLSDGATAGLYEYTPAGTNTAPTSGTLTALSYAAVNTDANNYNVVLDALGDPYTVSYKKSTCGATTKACQLVEFIKGATTPYTAANTFSSAMLNSPGVGGARGLALDVNTGNFWQTDIVENQVSLFKLTPSATAAAASAGSPTVLTVGTAAGTPATNNYGSVAVSIDKNSTAWVVVQGGPATTGSTATAAVPAGLFPITSAGVVGAQVSNVAGTSAANGGLTTPGYVAIDGNNNLFVANTGASATTSSVVEYSPSFNSNAGAFLSPNLGFSPGATYTGGALTGGTVYQAQNIVVDRSGALWILSGGTGTGASLANVVQILGVAAPLNPVLAAGKYGVKP